jgi:hypothetical protein
MSYKLEKPYTDKQRADFVCEHQGLNYYEDDDCIIMYLNTEKIVNGEAIDISQTPEYIAEELAKAKADKLQENTTKRDARLIAGVTYKNILFDSDQDQKINLSAIASNMSDTDTITWFGKDGVSSLNCTKTDIENIGKLIISLTQDVWSNLNPTYIDKINACKTIEELNEIEIDYAV